MSFKKYKTIDEVLNTYQLSYQKKEFLGSLPNVKMPELLKSELDYVMDNFPYKASEAAIRETILFPILKEAWKKYDHTLMVWSNKSISYSKDLGGMPDYIVAKQSHLGKIVFGKPLLAVVEAKKDDFEGGWAQCALEMYIIQKINGHPDLPVYGIVTNGDNWEFGKLENILITNNDKFYTIQQQDDLYAAVTMFYDLCNKNAAKL